MKSDQLRVLAVAIIAMFCSLSFASEQGQQAEHVNDIDNIPELTAFMDGAVEAYLRNSHSPGATVSIVKDGKIIFAKGYGFADFEKQIPVDPRTTLFRIASITKIFTATAIMQLVENGKLDLDRDIDSYLGGFEVKKSFSERITLSHLMTHSAGFEDPKLDQIIVDYEEGDPMNSILEDMENYFPEQVRAPGTYASYSNHGVDLMGLIIEEVSGQTYHDYIEQHILEPLGMSNTTPHQPVPDNMKANMSVGYHEGKGPFRAGPFNIAVGTVAGSISSSASDMARFMIMHLQQGEYQGHRIISAETAGLMQSRQFGHDARLPGMALQFIEYSADGERFIGHSGGMLRQLSEMILIPGLDIGIFVSFNSANGQPDRLARQFLDRYFSYEEEVYAPLNDTEDRLSLLTGSYLSLRRGYTHFGKVALLMGFGVTEVSNIGNGNIGFAGSQYFEIEPFMFKQINGHARLVFKTDDSGRVTHMLAGINPSSAYEKSTGFAGISTQQLIGLVIMPILLLSTLIWAFRGFRGVFVPASISLFEKNAWRLSAVPGLLLLFLLSTFPADVMSILNGFPRMMSLALKLNYLLFPVSAAMAVITVQAWRKRYLPTFDRVLYSLVTLTTLIAVWWLNNWNMIGY